MNNPMKPADILRQVQAAATSGREAPGPDLAKRAATPLPASAPEKRPRAARPARPAHTVQQGPVETRVWENRGRGGVPEWRFDQVRLYAAGAEECSSTRSLGQADVPHAIRGYYLARKWVRKQERAAGRVPWWCWW